MKEGRKSKMKNIMLSLVVMATLIAGGLTGTFAHFSDTEESTGNYVDVGAMDLKVGGFDDPDVVALWGVEAEPDVEKSATITLKNVGQPAGDDCHVYIHFKNFNCENIDADPNTAGIQNPEPENVAQNGGWLGQMLLRGLGTFGDDCSLASYIGVTEMTYDGDPIGLSYYDEELGNDDGHVKLDEVLCHNILLGALDKGDEKDLEITIMVQDIDEDEIAIDDNDLDGLVDEDPVGGGDNDGDGLTDEDGPNQIGIVYDNDGDGRWDEDPTDLVDNDLDGKVDEDPAGYFDGDNSDVASKCWDHWPTNALMKDKLTFDLLFSLVEGAEPD
jgi:predicted ribosomally synthesized peptide with SipW-like signal peptide